MSDPKLGLNGRRGPRGERGERGERGHRGRDGSPGPTGATGSSGIAPIIAAAVVAPDGTVLSNVGFSSIVRTILGTYDLTLANPPPTSIQTDVNVTPRAVIPTIAIASTTGAVITVQTFTFPANVVTQSDASFHITVVDSE
jgi:collagen triple helix repeat protein